MTEQFKYSMGEGHTQWTLTLIIHQRGKDYKLVLSDSEDDTCITTGYVSPATANTLEKTINNALYRAGSMESIEDVLAALQVGFYGSLFTQVKKEGATA